jgi:ABC-type transport system substrate-binding protein
LYHQIQTEKLLSDLNLDLFPAYGLIPATLPGTLNLKDVTDLRKEPSPNPKAMNITLDYMEGDVTDQQIASYLKNSWEKWGIKVILHGYNTTDYLERLFKAESAAILGKKGMDYPDGFSTLGYFQKSYPGSYFHVADNEIDMLIQRAAGEFDDSIRIAFYREIQKKILRHYTIIPITFGSPESGLWSNRVEFTPSHPMGFHTIPLEMIEMSKVNF